MSGGGTGGDLIVVDRIIRHYSEGSVSDYESLVIESQCLRSQIITVAEFLSVRISVDCGQCLRISVSQSLKV